jgi:hypothetical protein
MDSQTVRIVSWCITKIRKHTNELLYSADKNNLSGVMHHKEMIDIYNLALSTKLAEITKIVQKAQPADPGNPKEYNG